MFKLLTGLSAGLVVLGLGLGDFGFPLGGYVALLGIAGLIVALIETGGRPGLDAPLWAAVLVALLFPATSIAADTTIDYSSVGNQLISLIFAGIGIVFSWIVKRGVVAIEAIHLLQSGQVHGDVIDSAVDDAVAWATSRIEAIADPVMKVQMSAGITAEAAQMVVTSAPAAMNALGLTPEAVAAKIKLALGDPLAAPKPVTPAPLPPAPVLQPGTIVQGGTLAALTLMILLVTPGCTPAEVASASADFAEGCADWNAAKGIVGEAGAFLPSPLNQVAAVTESFVGDACDNQAFIAKAGPEQAEWIHTSAANLRAVAAQAGK